jgi:hypothetical protein
LGYTVASPITKTARAGTLRLGQQRCSWLLLLLPTLLLAGCKTLPQTTESDRYRVFYYNASSELLQVEVVGDRALSDRVLEDVNTTKMTIPSLTATVAPKVSGTNKTMSKFATIAVYYTFEGTPPAKSTPNVQARPVKVEDLQWVPERTLAVCAARSSTDPCRYPSRCHCTGMCCCY